LAMAAGLPLLATLVRRPFFFPGKRPGLVPGLRTFLFRMASDALFFFFSEGDRLFSHNAFLLQSRSCPFSWDLPPRRPLTVDSLPRVGDPPFFTPVLDASVSSCLDRAYFFPPFSPFRLQVGGFCFPGKESRRPPITPPFFFFRAIFSGSDAGSSSRTRSFFFSLSQESRRLFSPPFFPSWTDPFVSSVPPPPPYALVNRGCTFSFLPPR